MRQELELTCWSSAIEAISESVNAFSYCKHIFILADFNVDHLQPSTNAAGELLSFLYQRNFEQLLNEPTKVTNSTALYFYWTLLSQAPLIYGLYRKVYLSQHLP